MFSSSFGSYLLRVLNVINRLVKAIHPRLSLGNLDMFLRFGRGNDCFGGVKNTEYDEKYQRKTRKTKRNDEHAEEDN